MPRSPHTSDAGPDSPDNSPLTPDGTRNETNIFSLNRVGTEKGGHSFLHFHQSRLFNGRLCSACRSRSRRVLHRTLRCRICQRSALGHHSLRGMRATLSHLGTRHQCRTRFKVSTKPPFFCTTTPCARRSEHRPRADLRRAAHGTPPHHTTLPELPANGKVSSVIDEVGSHTLPPADHQSPLHHIILPFYSLCFTFL